MAANDHKERLITRDVALIMAATFFFMTASMMGGPIVAGFAHTLGANGALMGFIAGALSLAALFCRPIAGRLSDRTSKRVLAVIGGALYLITNVWYAYASSRRRCSPRASSTASASPASRCACPHGSRRCCRCRAWAPAWDCTGR